MTRVNRSDGQVGSRNPAIVELVAVRGPELDFPEVPRQGRSRRRQDGLGSRIKVLEPHAPGERQLVGRVLPDREGQAEALFEYSKRGPLFPHPLRRIVGLAEIAAKLELSQLRAEPHCSCATATAGMNIGRAIQRTSATSHPGCLIAWCEGGNKWTNSAWRARRSKRAVRENPATEEKRNSGGRNYALD